MVPPGAQTAEFEAMGGFLTGEAIVSAYMGNVTLSVVVNEGVLP
jgi:hypothetical protein